MWLLMLLGGCAGSKNTDEAAGTATVGSAPDPSMVSTSDNPAASISGAANGTVAAPGGSPSTGPGPTSEAPATGASTAPIATPGDTEAPTPTADVLPLPDTANPTPPAAPQATSTNPATPTEPGSTDPAATQTDVPQTTAEQTTPTQTQSTATPTAAEPSPGQLVQGLNNPIIRHLYTADAAALVNGETLYVYAGHDEAPVGGDTFVLNNWHIFSTKDLAHWTDHGPALSVSDFSWASWGAWAGHVAERDGRFYWYVPMSSPRGGDGFDIGVAVGSSPTGPFVASDTPVLTDDMTVASAGNGQPAFKDIDPMVFVDDDGQAYLYWGNIDFHMARLADNMVEIEGAIEYPALNDFTEAPYVNKINGTYVLTYASGFPEYINYRTSSGPMGPWSSSKRLNGLTGSGTNHQALVQFRDSWYFVYHNAALFEGGEFRRSVSIEHLNVDSNGGLVEIVQTAAGVEQLEPGPFALDQFYQVINAGSGHALDLASASPASGVNVQQNLVSDSDTQHWQLQAVGAAVYRLVNGNSGLCLSVAGNSTADSANVEQAICSQAAAQRWRAMGTPDGGWMFVNYASNRVLEAANAATTTGANVVQYHSLAGPHQTWRVMAVN